MDTNLLAHNIIRLNRQRKGIPSDQPADFQHGHLVVELNKLTPELRAELEAYVEEVFVSRTKSS